MAFDGIVTGAIAKELNKCLVSGRIEKIYQPESDTLVLHIHTKQGNVHLYATCNSNHARIHLIKDTPGNPPVPSSFCMLLRKHLQGGIVVSVSQVAVDRIIEMEIETMDEMNFKVNKKIVFEIMGKHSNIVLIDMTTGKITDSIKRISPDINRARQVLPGKIYEYPPSQNKIPFSKITEPELVKILPDLKNANIETAAKRILDNIQGISPAVAYQLAQGAIHIENSASSKKDDLHMKDIDNTAIRKRLFQEIDGYRKLLVSGEYEASVYEKEPGVPVDFHVLPLKEYGKFYSKTVFNSISGAIEYYFRYKESFNRVKQKSDNLLRVVKTHLSKLYLKKKRLGEDIINAEKAQVYRLYGELLMANLHLIKTGDSEAVIINYYDDRPVTIPLDVRYAPAKNAQIYFKKYSKARTALKEKAIQIEENDKDIKYLESVASFIGNASVPEDVDAIRDELIETGYVRYRKTDNHRKKIKTEPLEYYTSDGFRMMIGRNNKENDKLTLKTASSSDWWFHTKDIPGSHVIVFSENKELTEAAILEAAAAAAYYSKARVSENVPVDYTLVKHVKKPNGAKPGMVIFTGNRTIYVTPSLPLAEPCS